MTHQCFKRPRLSAFPLAAFLALCLFGNPAFAEPYKVAAGQWIFCSMLYKNHDIYGSFVEHYWSEPFEAKVAMDFQLTPYGIGLPEAVGERYKSELATLANVKPEHVSIHECRLSSTASEAVERREKSRAHEKNRFDKLVPAPSSAALGLAPAVASQMPKAVAPVTNKPIPAKPVGGSLIIEDNGIAARTKAWEDSVLQMQREAAAQKLRAIVATAESKARSEVLRQKMLAEMRKRGNKQ